MQETRRAIAVGIVMALLTGAVVGGGAFWWVRTRGALAESSKPGRVVVVFAGPDEEGAQVAHVVAVLDTSTGTWEYPDPLAKVTVAGTSYERLREAYPFGGAQAVATALGASEKDGWVDVPFDAWRRLISDGVVAEVPERMNVFDGDRLVAFQAGRSTIPADDVSLLMNGATYLDSGARISLATSLASASVAALARAGNTIPAGATTNLSPEALGGVLAASP